VIRSGEVVARGDEREIAATVRVESIRRRPLPGEKYQQDNRK